MADAPSDAPAVADRYYDYRKAYPSLEVFKEKKDVVIAEAKKVMEMPWFEWPEKGLYMAKDKWDVFPFVAFTTWFDKTSDLCPETKKMLQAIPGIQTALYSRLSPGTTLVPHIGWGDLSNTILRCHFGIVAPPDSGMWVDGEFQQQKEADWIVFDDSKLHSGYNSSKDQFKVVLLVDITRPNWVPKGTAEVGFTPALYNLVQNLRQIL